MTRPILDDMNCIRRPGQYYPSYEANDPQSATVPAAAPADVEPAAATDAEQTKTSETTHEAVASPKAEPSSATPLDEKNCTEHKATPTPAAAPAPAAALNQLQEGYNYHRRGPCLGPR